MAVHYFIISYDADYTKPYGFAWFADIGTWPRNGSAFRYFATHAEAMACAMERKDAVLLDDDTIAA